MRTIDTIKTATLAGLAALTLSACAPVKPEEPQPYTPKSVGIKTGGNNWILYSTDSDPRTFEIAEQRDHDYDLKLVYHAPGHRQEALQGAYRFQLREMSAAMQEQFNALGNAAIAFTHAHEQDTYQHDLAIYKKDMEGRK